MKRREPKEKVGIQIIYEVNLHSPTNGFNYLLSFLMSTPSFIYKEKKVHITVNTVLNKNVPFSCVLLTVNPFFVNTSKDRLEMV